MTTVETVLKLLLELDQQIICPRPSMFGEAAELMADVARKAELYDLYRGLGNDNYYGKFAAVDLSPVRKPAPGTLSQPTLDAAETGEGRCQRCGWPLAERVEDGCTPGNCAERGT